MNKLSGSHEISMLSEEQKAKINFIRRSLGTLPDKLSLYCSDAAIVRHLIARNWDVKKAMKMLKSTLKWRLEYKPEEIRWEEVAKEAETGKIYRSDFVDKHGRCVLVMRPGCQNTKSTKGQIKFLVYCMENAVLNLPQDQDQMVWLIDFHGFSLSNISIKVTKETAHVLQDHYPERLGVAILYNPPKFFEPFWKVAKPFLEPKTCAKLNFVYSDDPASMKIMENLFDLDKLESAFGGNNPARFNIDNFANKMKEDDKKMLLYWNKENNPGSSGQMVNAQPTSVTEDSSPESNGPSERKKDWDLKFDGEEDNGVRNGLTSSDAKDENLTS